ncbi:hypothetical protein LNKW23_37750 [Paralimibaculum aggregatum]|uniref:MotA/TolQ/ExbB proton channel domain-containing protein n=1 Tax=Paralimibaculum aggregatum TaxID=3036245 RepID=A0ABQ6LMW4_9RHOB|nr:anti-phage ZorAB system protein ZorA [Limibaculum sp. NKW23]GMG84559.1 hypothetical protein LNKW23_37750 [Limibaculum sp. NKW23]
MFDLGFLGAIGPNVRDIILQSASHLREEHVPGWVAFWLLLALALFLASLLVVTWRKRSALAWLRKIVRQTSGESDFSARVSELDQKIEKGARRGPRRQVATAWAEYRETLVAHPEGDEIIQRNAVRPGVFFNLEDLHFGPGFWRILPGLFVTVGLFLTFLGLISALQAMGEDMSDMKGAMTDLLTVASAKFIMSLTGLFCSIVFTVGLRLCMGRIENELHGLNHDIERRLSFISLEDLAVEQLAAMQEQREHFRKIGLELVAELGRPLREEVPQAISSSIASAMEPVLRQVGQIGSDGMNEMVGDLSERFSRDVGEALAQSSQRLTEAGERIGGLVDRLNASSGQMGGQMEAVVERLNLAVEDLRKTMAESASSTTSAFAQGAESILAAMNQTLDGIRENTGEGASAMRTAAADMSTAADAIRSQLAAAAEDAARATKAQMVAAGAEAGTAITEAGQGVLGSFGKTAEEIARISAEMTTVVGQDVLEPMQRIGAEIDATAKALVHGSDQVRRASDGLRLGAEATTDAANSLRSSAQSVALATEPVRASAERIEGATLALAESTSSVAETARTNTESARDALEAANEILGGQREQLLATLAHLQQALQRMQGQGDRIDQLDESLGAAFETFTKHVKEAVDGLFGHVREMQERLSPALDTMREIVDQAERFSPQQRGR